MLQELFDFLFDFSMATCPVLGYVLQYRLIHKNQSVGAFSIDICLVLLVANILRLNFYPFKNFQTALVFQSIFMIAAQLVLLHACCSYKQQSLTAATTDDEDVTQKFWRWSSFDPFWQYTLLFTLCTALATLAMWLLGVQIYGQLIGLVALMTESMLILPQIIQIFRIGYVQGISYSLIFLNLIGDTFKTVYFFYNDQPFQFKLCGVIQLILDVFVISQIAYYKLKVKIDQINNENGSPRKEQELTGNNSPNNDLEGSLARSQVIPEHVQDIKQDSDTNL